MSEELCERLLKRSAQDRACQENNRVLAELLQPQMDLFDKREGGWNTYAVRMAVDHRRSMERDARWADDLEAAVAIIRAKMEPSPCGS